MSYVILLTEPIHEQGVAVLEQIGKVHQVHPRQTETWQALVPEAHVIIARLAKVTREVMEAAPHLRVIARHGVGVDNVDVAYATQRRIPVVYTPTANTESVAEHALAMLLALSKYLLQGDRAQRNGDFQARFRLIGREMQGKTLGLIGAGRIGSRVAQMCRAAFQMRVLAYDPYVSAEQVAGLGIELVSDLPLLLQEADYVSIHVPLTPTTHGLIGEREFALMKPTAVLVNTARGGVVDEQALYTALLEGQIAGAALDVWEKEPPPLDHPLFTLENVIVNPHMASHTEEALIRMAMTLAEDVARVLEGKLPHFCVNPEVLAQG